MYTHMSHPVDYARKLRKSFFELEQHYHEPPVVRYFELVEKIIVAERSSTVARPVHLCLLVLASCELKLTEPTVGLNAFPFSSSRTRSIAEKQVAVEATAVATTRRAARENCRR